MRLARGVLLPRLSAAAAWTAFAAAAPSPSPLSPPHSCMRHHSTSSAAAAAAAAASSSPADILMLGIESSCDDTAAAVVTGDGRVLGEAAAGQADVHAAYGGVHPAAARRAHEAAIDGVVADALARAGVAPRDLTAVAVTVGPGLSLCLDVGVRKARALSRDARLPLVPVHHMEAHALVARMPAAVAEAAAAIEAATAAAAAAAAVAAEGAPRGAYGSNPATAAAAAAAEGAPPGASGSNPATAAAAAAAAAPAGAVAEAPQFPFLCLLVSGGHNLLVLARGVGDYAQLGTTLDDALGEAFDKVARMLGLDARPHGGAALEALARGGDASRYKLPVPMRKHANCDFSFAGLKTGVRLCIERELVPLSGEGGDPEARRRAAADVAASFQGVATRHLCERVRRGIAWAREALDEEGEGGGGGSSGSNGDPSTSGRGSASSSSSGGGGGSGALRHLVVAGGVASNRYVRAALAAVAADHGLALVAPPPRWCTDNGAMVAWAGVERFRLGLWQPPLEPLAPQADGGAGEEGAAAAAAAGDEWVELRPRWPLTAERHRGCTPPNRSTRAPEKNARSLTEETREALAALAAGGGSGGDVGGGDGGAVAAAAAGAAAVASG